MPLPARRAPVTRAEGRGPVSEWSGLTGSAGPRFHRYRAWRPDDPPDACRVAAQPQRDTGEFLTRAIMEFGAAAALKHPDPSAIPGLYARLAFQEFLTACHQASEQSCGPRQVFGVNTDIPDVGAIRVLAERQVLAFAPVVEPADAVASKVQFPLADGCTPNCSGQSVLNLAQRSLCVVQTANLHADAYPTMHPSVHPPCVR